jgi:hypothetical protein
MPEYATRNSAFTCTSFDRPQVLCDESRDSPLSVRILSSLARPSKDFEGEINDWVTRAERAENPYQRP